MQILKWVILLIMVCIFVPEACQATMPVRTDRTLTTNTEAIDSRTNSMINSLVSLLRFNVGELSEDYSHSTYDKKSLLRLFIHLRYSNMQSPEPTQNIFIPREKLFTGPDQTAYYIYALHKIII